MTRLRLPLLLASLLALLFLGGWTDPPPPATQERLPSELTLLSSTELPVGKHFDVTVSLINKQGRPLPNKTIRVLLDGEQVRQARTEEDGTATIRVSKALTVGTYSLLLVFPGTEAYQGDYVTAEFVVRPIHFEVETIPPLPGVGFDLNGRAFFADDDGVAHIAVDEPGTYVLKPLPFPEEAYPDTHIEFARWSDSTFHPQREVAIDGDMRLQSGFSLSHRVQLTFHDLSGEPVPPERVSALTLKSSHGAVFTFHDNEARWFVANRIARRRTGLEVAPVQYSVESVTVDGANVVNKYQQRFLVRPEDRWDVELLLYFARFHARDALLGHAVGDGVNLIYPDGRVDHLPFVNDEVSVGPLARGLYKVQVTGVSGMAPETPVALSRDQQVELKVLTTVDIAAAVLLGLSLALGLLFYGRPELFSFAGNLLRNGRRTWQRWRHWLPGATVLIVLLLVGRPAFAAPPPQTDAAHPVPLMAYYYIWYDTNSWDRAKSDYPLLGRYSSDDRAVMEQHVQWAKEAGIDGFIVSWKGTLKLDRRLQQLMDVAAAADFRLWVIYQGLDFDRNPLPLTQIDADFDYFVTNYADHPAFAMYDRPLLIWSGTWEFTPQEIASVTSGYRDRLLILASERSVEGYQRVRDAVDGNAYYWSSVDPYGGDPLQQKLNAMSEAVHTAGGLWVAPAAPGFDARLVGGTRVIPRQDGNTLRLELDAATRSSPDAIGLISWNEFSENSHIEPSINYGTQALEVIGDVEAGVPPQPVGFDSSAPATTAPGNPYPLILLGLVFLLVGGSLTGLILRSRRQRPHPGHHSYPQQPEGGSRHTAALSLPTSARPVSIILIAVGAIGLLFVANRLIYTFSHWQTAIPTVRRAAAAPVIFPTGPPAVATEAASLDPTPAAEPEPERMTLLPVADGYVRAETPDKPGSDPNQLRSDGDPVVRSYLRFDLRTVRGRVLTATLRLHANSASSSGFEVHQVSADNWAESSLTFASAPLPAQSLGTSGAFASDVWVAVDVTSLFAGGTPSEVALAITSRSATNISYGSRESGVNAPQLQLVVFPAAAESTASHSVAGTADAPAQATPAPASAATSDPVLLAAGDIATCSREDDEATAALLDAREGTIATLGDLAYEDGSAADFATCYDASWGRFVGRTRPVPGNHEYRTADALPYFQEFGAAAGLVGSGYYSYTLGTWLVLALNSNCDDVGGCSPNSSQYQWLAQTLATSQNTCVLAYWHHPRWSSGEHGNTPEMDDIWQLLAENSVDLVLAGHDHDYERFAPLDAAGQPAANGIRSFVVGTGGKSHRDFAELQPYSEVQNNDTFGILQLTLGDGGYQWEFVAAEGNGFTDSGSGQCHP